MRALLVANPAATTTTSATREAIVGALRARLDIDVAWTQARGHAVELAAAAGDGGYDLVIGLGGDGTVNELVNGLLGPDARVPLGSSTAGGPAFAVIPGGSTNVFARALGVPRDPVAAAGVLLDAVCSGRARRIGLGRADGRWFTFAAGVGLDAEVVRRVEGRRARGSTSTPALYLREIAGTLARGGVVPVMQVSVEGAPAFPARMAVVANTRPWTYIGSRPIDPFPRASFEAGLDVFAVHRLDPLTVTRALSGMLRGSAVPAGRGIVSNHDVTRTVITADQLFPLELDGEAVASRRRLVIDSVPSALTVLA